MRIKILSILYTFFSILFLVILCIIKGTDNLFISLFAYLFILFVQRRVLVFKRKAFLNYIIDHPVINNFILGLGFFYYIVIVILLLKNVINNPFGFFLLTGCASSCFYTFLMCKKVGDDSK